jgi:hypothetical protein
MIKKILTGVGILGFICIGSYTDWLECLFNIDCVAEPGGMVKYCLLGLIAWILINKK